MFFNVFNSSYKKFTTLTGPRDAISSVSFSVDGTFVSAAGYGGITIWDLTSSAAVSTPHLPYEPHNKQHVYVSSAWMYFEGTDVHVFIVGNMSGQVSLWYFDNAQKTFRAAGNQVVDKNGTSIVMAIDVSEISIAPGHSGRIVTSTDDSTIAVWTLTSTYEFTNVFKIDPPDGFIPRIVKFARSTRNVFSFSKRGGGFVQLKGETGEYSWDKKDGPKEMHFVSVDEKHDWFVAWTGHRAELYRLSNSEFVRAFQGEVSLVGNTKQVSFAEDGSRLMVGTDHGFVEVYSVESGEILQRLEYPRKSLIQYLATLSLPSCHLVAIAGSTKSQAADVVVFKKKYCVPRSSSGADDNLIFSVPVTWRGIRWIGHIIIFFVITHVVLNRYSQAFLCHVETSLYPLGLVVQAFVFVPALSKFSSTHTILHGATTVTVTQASPVTTTAMERVYTTVTITEAAPPSPSSLIVTHTVTDLFAVTTTITEKLLSIATVTELLTIAEQLPATGTTTTGYPSAATSTSYQTIAEVGF
ncbi:hypothetical protein VKT23_013676 [Stygiomarasmius scandens]|uniref:WD40 repeat-like protein n=1 Tax=Marasmiellus scandens TaxID=2682957 RepID=A0ABR1J285_9AGAR